MVALNAEISFDASMGISTLSISRLRTAVVVGVAPTERTRGLEGEAECTVEAVTRRASNSWRR
jgi:hypothetical protein